jgi:hypothetical protein
LIATPSPERERPQTARPGSAWPDADRSHRVARGLRLKPWAEKKCLRASSQCLGLYQATYLSMSWTFCSASGLSVAGASPEDPYPHPAAREASTKGGPVARTTPRRTRIISIVGPRYRREEKGQLGSRRVRRPDPDRPATRSGPGAAPAGTIPARNSPRRPAREPRTLDR